jgi:hypothetical protein
MLKRAQAIVIPIDRVRRDVLQVPARFDEIVESVHSGSFFALDFQQAGMQVIEPAGGGGRSRARTADLLLVRQAL